jgi:hypothetical protein
MFNSMTPVKQRHNETRVREAEGIFKIEVPDNVRKIVIIAFLKKI